MNDLVKKYHTIIQSEDKSLWDEYAQLLEDCVKYLKPNNDLDIDTKVAATFVVKEIFLNNKDFKFDSLQKIVDDFIIYNENGYSKYMDDLALITDQFHADISFYKLFVTNFKY